MKRKIKIIPLKRKRKGLTNYKKRLTLLLSGNPRLVIRKSLKSIMLQVVEYSPAGDKVIVSAHSNELKKSGWKMKGNSLPASYLTGFLLGKKAKDKKVGKCILDMGLYPSVKGNKIYAALKGAVDAGLNVPHAKDVLPPEDRVKGKHIAEFAKNSKGKKEHKTQFSGYTKNNINPEEITKHFEETKQKIEGK
ncbi:50S ribosomal protein L18 [Candidatus Woesearchaeota archaeon]|nr:50S ribosomal protein L18 [Candidatus Woesearchaeota archaeon]